MAFFQTLCFCSNMSANSIIRSINYTIFFCPYSFSINDCFIFSFKTSCKVYLKNKFWDLMPCPDVWHCTGETKSKTAVSDKPSCPLKVNTKFIHYFLKTLCKYHESKQIKVNVRFDFHKSWITAWPNRLPNYPKILT